MEGTPANRELRERIERIAEASDPLARLDPQRSDTVDEVSRLANTIVTGEDDTCKLGRTMVRGLILHVLTAEQFTGIRNLVTVRQLIRHGASEIAAEIRAMGKEEIDPPHMLLWRSMELNPAFDGIVAGIGTQFCSMMLLSSKTYRHVLQNVIAAFF